MKVRLWATTRIDGLNLRAGAVVDVDEDVAQRIVALGLGSADLDAPQPVAQPEAMPEPAPKAKATKRKSLAP